MLSSLTGLLDRQFTGCSQKFPQSGVGERGLRRLDFGLFFTATAALSELSPLPGHSGDEVLGVVGSFGTNDLTQMTYGYSRDDAERNFLITYQEQGILEKNPFQTIDRGGVGKLMDWAISEGRKTRPTLEVGICGEHGGDPNSVEWWHIIGNNYVSSSPFRVPVARLAAAHAALKHSGVKIKEDK